MTDKDFKVGRLYPRLNCIREMSIRIAIALGEHAYEVHSSFVLILVIFSFLQCVDSLQRIADDKRKFLRFLYVRLFTIWVLFRPHYAPLIFRS